jgi:hypothetical protein
MSKWSMWALIFGLAFGCTCAYGQARGDSCGTAPSTSLGNNVTLINCGGETSNNLQATTASINWTPASTAHLLVFNIGQCNPEGGQGGCPSGAVTAAPLYVTDTNNTLKSTGTVTMVGNKGTLTGGLGWGIDGANFSSGYNWANASVTVGGTPCTLVTPITETTATFSGCPAGANQSYVGPAGVLPCTDTSDIPGASQAQCWAFPGSTAADTYTVHGPNTYSLSIVASEFSSTSGNFSLDAAAWPLMGGGLTFQLLTAAQTSATPAFKILPVLSTTGELVVFGAEHQVGPAYVFTGFSPLMTSVSGTTAANGDCGSATGACTNQVQTSAATFASAGAATTGDNSMSESLHSTVDEASPGMIAFTTTTTAFDAPTFAPVNSACGHNAASFCDNSGNFTPTSVPLAMPLHNPSCVVVTEYYSSGTPTAPTISGLTFADLGPGAVALSGAHIRTYTAANTSNAHQVAPSWVTNPQWTQFYEVVGGQGNCTLDGAVGVGYASAANQTTGSGGSSSSGSMTTVSNGDLICGTFGYSNGPPGAAGSGFTWVDPVTTGQSSGLAPATECKTQVTAATINPGATDANGSGDSYAGISSALKAPTVPPVVNPPHSEIF